MLIYNVSSKYIDILTQIKDKHKIKVSCYFMSHILLIYYTYTYSHINMCTYNIEIIKDNRRL